MPVTLARWDEAKGNRKACQGTEGCWFVAERGKNLNQVLEWQLGPRNLLESGWDILHPPAPDAAGGSKGCAATALGNRSEVGLQPSTRRLYLPKTCLTQRWLPVGTHPTNAWWRGLSPCPFSSALWERSKEAREEAFGSRRSSGTPVPAGHLHWHSLGAPVLPSAACQGRSL